MASTLSSLVNLLATNVANLEAAYAKAGQPVPSLDEVYSPSPLDIDPVVAGYREIVAAAANQLFCAVNSPFDNLIVASSGLYTTTLLGVVEDANIIDLLLEAGPKGLHVNEISTACGLEASIVARTMRYLAARHIFKELTPDVFTNNRTSSSLSKGKPIQEIKADPSARYDKSPFAGFISLMTDESLATASFINQWFKNPGDVEAPFNLGMKTSLSLWEWLEQPGNEWRAKRFATMMAGSSSQYPESLVTNAVDGVSLKEGSLLVDVGGGAGFATLVLYKAYPHLKYVVQDLPAQNEAAKEYWKLNAPEAIQSGQVQLQVHSFFEAQPIKNADIYFMRMVLHDWPDHKVKTIMSKIRAAAGPSSKFIVLDVLATYTCEDPASPTKAPAPLLANFSGAASTTYVDIHMLSMYNGKERTEADMRKLAGETGWKVEEIKPGNLAAYVLVPV